MSGMGYYRGKGYGTVRTTLVNSAPPRFAAVVRPTLLTHSSISPTDCEIVGSKFRCKLWLHEYWYPSTCRPLPECRFFLEPPAAYSSSAKLLLPCVCDEEAETYFRTRICKEGDDDWCGPELPAKWGHGSLNGYSARADDGVSAGTATPVYYFT